MLLGGLFFIPLLYLSYSVFCSGVNFSYCSTVKSFCPLSCGIFFKPGNLAYLFCSGVNPYKPAFLSKVCSSVGFLKKKSGLPANSLPNNPAGILICGI